ncbi:MAG: hypothetical protein NVV63_13670 [Opitutus sp.]|nr:hypothetical protein [Opitutus sp.]
MLDVLFEPEKADTYRTFEIVHPDVLALFNLTTDDGDGGKRFSFTQLEKGLPELQRQTQLAQPVEPQLRTPFQKDLVRLHSNVNLYQRLKYSLSYPGATDFLSELMQFQETLAAGVEAVRAKQAGQPHDEAAANRMIALGQNFIAMSQAGYLLAIPALAGENPEAEWQNAGNALLQTFETGQVSPFVLTYAGIGRTWRSGNADQFNEIVRLYSQQLERNYAATLKKCDAEVRFNSAEPFYVSTVLYVLAFLLGVFSWLRWPETLGRAPVSGSSLSRGCSPPSASRRACGSRAGRRSPISTPPPSSSAGAQSRCALFSKRFIKTRSARSPQAQSVSSRSSSRTTSRLAAIRWK